MPIAVIECFCVVVSMCRMPAKLNGWSTLWLAALMRELNNVKGTDYQLSYPIV
jgi:hypothetical protein